MAVLRSSFSKGVRAAGRGARRSRCATVRAVSTPNKRALFDELVATVEGDLRAQEEAHRVALEGATHAESKPENDKDTRALEASYLARGQAARVEALRDDLATLRSLAVRELDDGSPVALGAWVTLTEDEVESQVLVAPCGGGATLSGGRVKVVTPASPLGRALIGRSTGDVVEVELGGRRRELEVTQVR